MYRAGHKTVAYYYIVKRYVHPQSQAFEILSGSLLVGP